jgi:ABC-type branched-subunit amino acid transport system ATPase component
VKDLDLGVPAGARLGLIDPNGSGKTTVLNLVSGVLSRTAARSSSAARASRNAGVPLRSSASRTFQNLRLVAHDRARECVARASTPAARRVEGARGARLAAWRDVRCRRCRCSSA